jgi:glutamine amidotransferase
MSIAIVDYGLGNTGSILNMLRHLGIESYLCDKPDDLNRASRIILPGVGAFDHGMNNLTSTGMVEKLNELVIKKQLPVLGICLGMQLMSMHSTEGTTAGLGWINASTIGFSKSPFHKLRIPHTGWNNVKEVNPNPLLKNLPDDARFYFVHSYHVQCHEPALIGGQTNYGGWFDSVIVKNNIFGCQFHPEKSHRYGMAILENFNQV